MRFKIVSDFGILEGKKFFSLKMRANRVMLGGKGFSFNPRGIIFIEEIF